MRILINELSFVKQAKSSQHGSTLMNALKLIVDELEPIRGNDLVHTHSSFWNYYLTDTLSVKDWMVKLPSGDDKRFWVILMTKGPYIDKILDEELAYHECLFEGENCGSSSLAGAFFLMLLC